MIILSFAFLAFISASLLLQQNSLKLATDMPFHFRRIMELRTTIMHNDFLPNFAFNDYQGSAVMLLYPYLNLYPIVLLSLIVKSKIALIYIFFILNTFVTFIISFYSCKSYTKNISSAYLFAIIYSLSNIFLSHNFLTMDFGIVSSYMILPLIIFGFINIIDNKNNWLKLSLGMTLIAFSHVLNLVIFTLLLIVWLFLNFKRINKYVIIQLFKAISLFVMLTSVIWLPFFNFYIKNLGNINMPASFQLIRSGIKPFLAGIYGKVDITNIGPFALVALIISIFFYKNFNMFTKQMYFLSLGIILLVLLFPKELTSYGIFKILNQFQFTYRLYIIPHILLIFIFSLIITKFINKNKIMNILYSSIIVLAIFLQIIGQYNIIDRPNINIHSNYQNSNIYKYKINNSEQFMKYVNNYGENDDYIPKKSLSVFNNIRYNKVISDNSEVIPFENVGYNTFRLDNKNFTKVSLPIYMYNGEQVQVYINNKPVDSFVNKNKLLSISNIPYNNNYNLIYIKMFPDKFRIIGIILSGVTLLFLLILIIMKIKRSG